MDDSLLIVPEEISREITRRQLLINTVRLVALKCELS